MAFLAPGVIKIIKKLIDKLKLSDVEIKDFFIMRKAIESNNGWVFKTVGDAFCLCDRFEGESLPIPPRPVEKN